MHPLAPAAETFVAQQATPNTRRAYRADLNRWLAFFDPAAAAYGPGSVETVIKFRDMLATTTAPATAARVYATCRSFTRFVIAQGIYDGPNAFELVRAPKRITNQTPEVPADEDVEATVAATEPWSQRRLVIALLLNGLRASEVCDLRKEDIVTVKEGMLLRVIGKGLKERLVPATVEVERALSLYFGGGRLNLTQAQLDSPWVVADYDGSRRTVRQVEHAVYKAAEYAGVEGLHPHSLRHHYATRLIRAGATVLHVQKLLGHSRADTTQVYVTLDTRDLFEAAAKDPRNQTAAPELTVVAA